MAITKCLIWLLPVNQFTVTERALSQCGRTSDWNGPRWLGWRKIMSKTTAINPAATSERELTEAELDAVSGGFFPVIVEAIRIFGPGFAIGYAAGPDPQGTLNAGLHH
jgi:lactobin A/cerein 7B family class IIb bacteriocin